MADPKVSILIPTYNYAHYLQETIQSALDQTYSDFELLIVDNHSTDNTEQTIQKYLRDPRVSYHKNAENLGVVGNFNQCLKLAKGEYIKFLCADDKFHPKLLEKYVPIMDQNPNVSLITCDKQAFGNKSHQTITPLTHMQKGREANLHMLIGNYCWIGEPTSVMFRKRDLKVGNFSSEYPQYTDWEMWIRLLTVGDCYIVPEILAYVRFHPGTNSKAQKKRRFSLCFEEYKLCKDVQKQKYNIDTTGSGIDEAVRKRAVFCIKQAMLKTIPELYKKQSRQAFVKAFKIAYEERLFLTSISELFSGVKRKTFRLIVK
jgi:glycosyltransferase involved in cell wall biosynthesis